jgi:GT2 family glycosyltransferase
LASDNRNNADSDALNERDSSVELRIEELDREPTVVRTHVGELRSKDDAHQRELQDVRRQLTETRTLLIQKEGQLNRILGTFGWQVLTRYGSFKHRFMLPPYRAIKRLVKLVLVRDEEACYREWTAWCERLRYNPEKGAKRIQQFKLRPLISIVMPVYNPAREYLSKAIDSVMNQYYPNWELCIYDDGSTARHVREVLEEYSSMDDRIRLMSSLKNGGIAVASNRALELATGELVGFLDHDDELTPDALLEVVTVLQETEADLIYSDEDKLDPSGRRCQPFFKPAWSPDLLFSTMYTCHFSVYRKRLIDQIDGFREGLDGSQDYDLALRFTEKTDRIAHIPKILYHWRQAEGSAAASVKAKPFAYEAGKAALGDALRRREIVGEVETQSTPGFYRVRRRIVSPGKVTIVIPTRDRLRLLQRCLSALESKTSYANFEIIIVDNGSKNSATLDYLGRSAHRVIREDRPFNFSSLNNIAAKKSDGEYLLFLNDDTEVIAAEWLTAMVEHAQRPEVGAVGAKLLYPNGRVQHAGVMLGVCGVAGHSHRKCNGGFGYVNFPNVIRNYSAVTGACLMVRRDLFNLVGRFDENFAVCFNDVDLCLRLIKQGYLIVYTPYALLYHHEKASRAPVDHFEESYLLTKWSESIANDLYYSPNQSPKKEDFSVDYSTPDSVYQMCAYELADGEVRLVGGGAVGQEFTALADNLCAVGIRLAIDDRNRKGLIRMHLRESHQSNYDIRLAEINASRIKDNEDYIFFFDPVRDAKGKNYYFFVDYANQASNAVVTVRKSSITSAAAGPYFENHLPARGTLSFRLYGVRQFRCLVPSSCPAQIEGSG